MKKRTAFIGAILSLIPLGQPLLIKTGAVLSISALMISLPDKLNAGDNSYYFNRAYDKAENGDHYGAISDYTKAIEIDPSYGLAYSNRGYTKGIGFGDDQGACDDFKKAASLGYQYRIDWLQTSAATWCRDM